MHWRVEWGWDGDKSLANCKLLIVGKGIDMENDEWGAGGHHQNPHGEVVESSLEESKIGLRDQ